MPVIPLVHEQDRPASRLRQHPIEDDVKPPCRLTVPERCLANAGYPLRSDAVAPKLREQRLMVEGERGAEPLLTFVGHPRPAERLAHVVDDPLEALVDEAEVDEEQVLDDQQRLDNARQCGAEFGVA